MWKVGYLRELGECLTLELRQAGKRMKSHRLWQLVRVFETL